MIGNLYPTSPFLPIFAMEPLLVSGACILTPSFAADAAADPTHVKLAVEKAAKVVQSSMSRWYDLQQCGSCHHTALPAIALIEARERGVPIDEAGARRHFVKYFRPLTDLDRHVQGYDSTDSAMSETYSIFAAQAAGLGPNIATAAERQSHFCLAELRVRVARAIWLNVGAVHRGSYKPSLCRPALNIFSAREVA